MGTWYRMEYEDIGGFGVRVDLIKEGNVQLIPERINGTVEVAYDDVDTPFEVLRSSTATINVEASLNSDNYQDLYSEIEREWLVKVYRNSTIDFLVWQGYLLPDQIFEDYVNSNWIVTMIAECGLNSLSNKAYVDGNGDLYTGKTSLRHIITNCISRTGILSDVSFQQYDDSETEFPVQVNTNPGTEDFFDQQIDQIAFVDADGETSKSCKEVLEQVLGLCNGFIFSEAQYWTINWAPHAGNPDIDGSYKYQVYKDNDPDNTPISRTGNGIKSVGPERGGYNLHWVNANQRIERRPSIGEVKSTYNYGQLNAINSNPELDNNGTTISGWTVDLAGSGQLISPSTVEVTSGGTFEPKMTNDATVIDALEQSILVISLKFGYFDGTEPNVLPRIGVVITDGVDTYYLRKISGTETMEWTTSATTDGFATRLNLGMSGAPGSFNLDIETPPVPIECSIQLIIYPGASFVGTTGTNIIWDYIGVGFKQEGAPQGEDHSAERIASPSSFVDSDQNYDIGDYSGTVYRGTIFRADGITETDQGYLNPINTNSRVLLEQNVIDRSFLRSSPARVFEGDVLGTGLGGQRFLPYNSVVEIVGFIGIRWMVVGWKWDTKLNTFSVKLWQMHWTTGAVGNNAVLDDIEYEKILNFGNVIEPTIKG